MILNFIRTYAKSTSTFKQRSKPIQMIRRRPLIIDGVTESRTYQDDLYAARRIPVEVPNYLQSGLSRLTDTLFSEGIVKHIRSKRQYTRPGEEASMGAMRKRQSRFDAMVKKTITDIQEIYRRLQ